MNTEEFEYSVVGAICIDPRIIDKLAPILLPDDFTISACAEIYESAVDAASRGKAFDAVYAADAIRSRIDEPVRFVKDCMELCPTLTNAEIHAKEIHKRAQLRTMSNAIRDRLFAADVGAADPNDIAADIAGVCQDFLVDGRAHRYSTMADALGVVYNRVTSPTKEERIETGFTRLDALLKGMPNGNLVFIGARPSVGKSAFALSVGEHVARKSGTVLLYSLEMLADECAERSVAKMSDITMDKLIDGELDAVEQGTLAKVCSHLSDLPMKIFDTPNVTPAVIRRDARMFKDVKLIIVDFISLMGSDRKYRDNRNLELGAISRDLKNLSVELKVPVLVLSQLNRTKDEKTEPSLSDLRDSGELEQNANKVMFLWLLDTFPDGTKNVGVSVAKNRRGRLGAVKMEFDGSHMRFVEIDYLSEAEKQKKPHNKYGGGIVD